MQDKLSVQAPELAYWQIVFVDAADVYFLLATSGV